MAKRSVKKTTRPASRPRKAKGVAKAKFRLTYATMFDPPAHMHSAFEKALTGVKAGLGREYPMWIGGKERLMRGLLGSWPLLSDQTCACTARLKPSNSSTILAPTR
jgi:hypothetical protein